MRPSLLPISGMALLLLLLLLLPFASCYMAPTCSGTSTNKDKIYIQGFVPATGDVYTSETIVPAATVACEEINSNSSILGGYELIIDWSDTMCDASEATWQLIQVVLEKDGVEPPHRIMFLGGGCSPATEPLAALSGRFYNVTQVSYGASTPTLSDRQMFPKFFRTIPSEVQSNSARFALMNRYDWSRVATLHETRNIFSLTVTNFREEYDYIYNNNNDSSDEEGDDENLVIRSFTDDPGIPLNQIKDKDIRIILAYMYEDKALITVCQALHMNLTSSNHLWMFPAWYEYNWWYRHVSVQDRYNCTPEQMKEAVRYSFFLDSYNFGTTDRATSAGKTKAEFNESYFRALEEFNTPDNPFFNNETTAHAYVTFTYDAVWTMALAMDSAEADLRSMDLSLKNFTYEDKHGITDRIFGYMTNTSYYGISGDVAFDSNGTRVGLNGIYQLVDSNSEGGLELVLLYIHDPKSVYNYSLPANYSEWEREPLWKGGSPPKDRRQPDSKYLNRDLIIACGVFLGLAILVAVGLLIFNLATIWKPLIRDSAPLINVIIILGCILMLGSCYLLGIDTRTPSLPGDDPSITDDDLPVDSSILQKRNERYGDICNTRLWLLTLGFTLSFGALFSKTWQVYRVYTNPKLKSQPFKMWNFLIILGIFLSIDVIYLLIWTVVFPFERAIDRQENDNKDTVEVYEKCECDNFGYLIGALYVYKGLLVVFGLFLAYESRNVKYKYINDSRFVSIAMYIVVIVVGIGAPLSLVLSVHFFIDPAYALAVFMVILATMSCLLILFIPKFIYMAKGLDTMVNENTREEVTASDGLQLGHTSVDQSDIQTAEEDVKNLQQKVAESNIELQNLQAHHRSEPPKTRNGSDGDSGVLVTTTEDTEVFTETSANGEVGGERRPSTTPTTVSSSPNMTGEAADEGAEI